MAERLMDNDWANLPPLSDELPGEGIRSIQLEGINGLSMHLLAAGENRPGQPCVILLHGFPELAYSWRFVLPRLAAAGYFAVAPDLRGYGRTGPPQVAYESSLRPYSIPNRVRDQLYLLAALGRDQAVVVGHDYGSLVAAWSALMRPDRFPGLAIMSAPFGGPPDLAGPDPEIPVELIGPALASLSPARQHYQDYYRETRANAEMVDCDQGVHDFLRGYFHFKSGDHEQNRPFQLREWTAAELARLPTYYVMEKGQSMAETVGRQMPTPSQIKACKWLSDQQLAVYCREFERTGFQGALNSYRCGGNRAQVAELQVFAGRRLEVPCLFISGERDWGVYQSPGGLDRLREQVSDNLIEVDLLSGAGHWVQMESPLAVSNRLIEFLSKINWVPA